MPINQILIIIVTQLLFSVGIVSILFILFRKRNQQGDNQTIIEWIKSTQTQLSQTNSTINQSLNQNQISFHGTLQQYSKNLNQQLAHNAQHLSKLQNQLGEIAELGRTIKDMQELLQSPKLRGNLGETVLYDLVSQMFPQQQFQQQYQFKTGDTVDLVLKTEAGLLPIDAKFPMENYRKMIKETDENNKHKLNKEFRKDVGKHIKAISQKYIRTEENTQDFAIMYIPVEPIYYHIVNNEKLLEYARDKRVYIVSPSTIYALLQIILLSFEGKKIESKSKQVLQKMRSMESEYQHTAEQLGVLYKHIHNAHSKAEEVQQHYSKIGQHFEHLHLLEEK